MVHKDGKVTVVRIRQEDGLWDIQRERGPSASRWCWQPIERIPKRVIERASLIMLQGKGESTALGYWHGSGDYILVRFEEPFI